MVFNIFTRSVFRLIAVYCLMSRVRLSVRCASCLHPN